MEDSLLTILQEQTRVATRTETKVDDLNKRLFGNGQPGVIQKIHEAVKANEENSVKVHDELQARITSVDTAYKMDRRWLAGAIAMLAFEGMLLIFALKYISSILSVLDKLQR